jgi:hypothetical protein
LALRAMSDLCSRMSNQTGCGITYLFQAREASPQVNVSSESLSTPQSVYAAAETGIGITSILVRGYVEIMSGSNYSTDLITHCKVTPLHRNVIGPSPAQISPLVGRASQPHLAVADLPLSSKHQLRDDIVCLSLQPLS